MLARFSTAPAVLLALAVSFPDSARAAPPGKGGGCTGGDLINAMATLRNDPTDGIKGGPYEHCKDGQVTIGSKEGRFRLDTKKYNPNGTKVDIQVDLLDCIGICSSAPPAGFNDALFQTHTRYSCDDEDIISTCEAVEGTVLNFNTMVLGEVEYTQCMIGFEKGVLHFRNATDALVAGSPVPCDGNPLKITCESVTSGSCNEWTIEGDKACFYKAAKNQPNVYQGIFSVPFRATVKLLP